jgi:ribosome-associated protein
VNQRTEPSKAPSTSLSTNRENQLLQSLEMAKAAVRVAAENRGQEILLLDLSKQTSIFDYFLIVTGASRRQLAAICTEIDRMMKTSFHERKLSVSGYEESRWIILDYGNIVVHLFDEDTRRFYDLESLWGDAQVVDVQEIIAAASSQMTRLGHRSEQSLPMDGPVH